MIRTCAKYRTIFDLIDEMIFLVDVNGKIIEYNKAAARVMGCDPVDLINKPIRDLINKEHWGNLYQILNSSEVHKVYKVEFVTLNGINFDAFVQIYKVKTSDEEFSILFIKDIKPSEGNNNLNVLVTMNALQYAQTPIEIADKNKEILYVNPAFERKTGYATNELVGKNNKEIHDNIKFKETTWKGNVEIKGKDGTAFDSLTYLVPIENKDTINGYLIFFTETSIN